MTIKTDYKRAVSGIVLLAIILLQISIGSAENRAKNAVAQGNFIEAINIWNQQQTDEVQGKELITLLIRRGEAYRAIGRYSNAAADFKNALDECKTAKYTLLEIIATQSLGYIYFLQNKLIPAQTLLNSAFTDAKTRNKNTLAAICANRLGTILYKLGQAENARIYYLKALKFVKEEDPGLRATIYRNLAHIEKNDTTAFNHLLTAQKIAQTIESPYEQAELLLEIATEAKVRDKENKKRIFRYNNLDRALKLSERINSTRLISLAAGEIGLLYENCGQFGSALKFTEKAVTTAQLIDAQELLLRWEWQTGRILQALDKPQKAIAALWRAVYYIQTLRQNLATDFNDECASFQKDFSPLYLELADMLLQEAGKSKNSKMRQKLLKDAQFAVESIKQSEIRDYFKDPCIDALSSKVESLAPATAVIYPIIFPDRLEILIDIGGKLHRKTSNVNKKKVERTVRRLAGNLRNHLFYDKLGKKVYSWLIAPVKPLLTKHQIDTLIFVPDGVFRMLSIAALYDGEKFLAEDYAVATEPGLSLLDPKPLPRGDMKTLLAGVSRPGPVVLQLPEKLWTTLCQTNLQESNRGIRGFSVKTEQLRNINRSNPVLRSSANAVKHVKQILALPGVDQEIKNLAQILPNLKMMNQNFSLQNFSDRLKQGNYRIVHIASHGFFGGSPEQNFIMTYDKCLNMNNLEEYLKPKQLAESPVELITLSACQTAEGDEQSPLGLAGVALKSGARSVIGSLWPVSDQATQLLLAEFYANLKDEKISKAEALRQAQIKLINEDNFEHPFYWSAFILVGNWL